MRVAAFTSLTTSYLPNGRIIAESFKKHHPEMDFVLLFNDRTPDFINWADEPFDHVMFSEWLDIGRPWKRWAYDYSVIEHCTATKGRAAEVLMDRYGYDLVIYLDPDTQVFSRLTELETLVGEGWDFILTPHLTDPETTDYGIWSHEIAALKHGTFNLGFFVVANRPAGRAALRWWSERLLDYSHIDFVKGTFTDQKWANLMPYLFEKVHVLLDRAYNVATWNVKNRNITQSSDGEWLVNGQPLRFYHFSGFGHDFSWANSELANFAKNTPDLIRLWDNYKTLYSSKQLSQAAPKWYWGQKADKSTITQDQRVAVRCSHLVDPYVDG